MNLHYFLNAPVSLTIFISTFAISIWGLINEDLRDKHTLVPYDMIMYKEYYRLLTSGWMHGNVMHLLFNMTTFLFFGFMLEYRLGHWQFALLYLLGLLLSNLIPTFRYRRDTGYEGSVGASGAIAAVVLSAVICNPYLKFGIPILSTEFPILQLPGYIAAAAFVLYSLYFSIRKPLQSQVNHDAHFWGAIAGIGLTFLLKPGVTVIIGRFISSL
jgi:membrane associated rhomboid family serine protease